MSQEWTSQEARDEHRLTRIEDKAETILARVMALTDLVKTQNGRIGYLEKWRFAVMAVVAVTWAEITIGVAIFLGVL